MLAVNVNESFDVRPSVGSSDKVETPAPTACLVSVMVLAEEAAPGGAAVAVGTDAEKEDRRTDRGVAAIGVSRMEHQTPSVFPGNFRKRKVLGPLCFPFCLPEKLVQANPSPQQSGRECLSIHATSNKKRPRFRNLCSSSKRILTRTFLSTAKKK